MAATHELGKFIFATFIAIYVIAGILILNIPNIVKPILILMIGFFIYKFIINGNNSL